MPTDRGIFVRPWPLLPLALLAGCSTGTPDKNAAAAAAATALDAEAERASDDLWNKLLTRCGSRTLLAGFITGWSSDGPGVSASPDGYGSIAELDHPSWRPVRQDLSKADTLNGLAWRGITVITAAAIREKYRQQSDFGLWHAPARGIPDAPKAAFAVVLAKVHGSWLFNGRPLSAIDPVKVDCAHPTTFPPADELRPGAAADEDKRDDD